MRKLISRVDSRVEQLSQRMGFLFLQLSIGIIYIWFGGLKFFPGLSPAEEIASQTLSALTFHLLDDHILLIGLAIFEIFIGCWFLFGKKNKILIGLLMFHMLGTITPLFLFPEEIFSAPPLGFSILGQYIMKNLVIISAGLILYTKE